VSRPTVVIVGYENAALLEMACVLETFDAANRVGATPPYVVRLASPGGRAVTSTGSWQLAGQLRLERLTGPIDTLVVAGGFGSRAAADDVRLVGHIRRLAGESRRVASVCTGAEVLAATGLLDGRRATTHWNWAGEIAARYPRVTIDPTPIYIKEGRVATAAGVTSALDLALAFVEEDHGAELARDVARGLVTYLHRPGNQAQMSTFVAAPPVHDALVRRVVDTVHTDLAADLATPVLAALVGVSERHLTRLFLAELEVTPARFVRRARTEAAAQLLARTDLPVARIAGRCGFGSPETLRQAFVDHYGTAPTRFRIAQRTSGGSGSRTSSR
jgi:transcriptional regulator GlxA family with amidase domain